MIYLQVFNRDAHGRPADIYSLGKLLLELLSISVKKKNEVNFISHAVVGEMFETILYELQ